MSKAVTRCKWAEGVSLDYIEYHDREWGVPVFDDRVQFEFLILEGAQAGLSWSTILNKRDGYRRAFADFDPVKVARFTDKRIEKLLQDPGIVRNRLKVHADIPATSPESDALSKDLKKRGFKFVGSTIIYAHMQATGLVNDHVVGCFRYKPCQQLAKR
jgi:DNA-3-methyladenine glycosylase I